MKVLVKPGVQDQFIGFFDHVRRRPGDVFQIQDEPRRELFKGERALVDGNDEARAIYELIKDKDGKIASAFSFRWMEPVAPTEKEKHSTSQQAMDRRSAEIKQEKSGQRALDAGTVRGDVI